uniref:(California timema) hypothetical protein n=1 Tax=Timema californicum TaxID=61474 RepID=A0A7R9IXP5_TIMCA|nr:unnamed protein product [Timema californicum]
MLIKELLKEDRKEETSSPDKGIMIERTLSYTEQQTTFSCLFHPTYSLTLCDLTVSNIFFSMKGKVDTNRLFVWAFEGSLAEEVDMCVFGHMKAMNRFVKNLKRNWLVGTNYSIANFPIGSSDRCCVCSVVGPTNQPGVNQSPLFKCLGAAHSFKVQTRSTAPSVEGGNSAPSVTKKNDIHGAWFVRYTTSLAWTSCLGLQIQRYQAQSPAIPKAICQAKGREGVTLTLYSPVVSSIDSHRATVSISKIVSRRRCTNPALTSGAYAARLHGVASENIVVGIRSGVFHLLLHHLGKESAFSTMAGHLL